MRYFADTSFWLALLSRRDAYHAVAVQRRQEIGSSPLVTTDLDLSEVLNSCAASPLRAQGASLFDRCLADSQIEIVWATPDLISRGVELYKSRLDKRWGLTDCVSFLVMQDAQIQDALTSDHHFEQAGFRALLR